MPSDPSVRLSRPPSLAERAAAWRRRAGSSGGGGGAVPGFRTRAAVRLASVAGALVSLLSGPTPAAQTPSPVTVRTVQDARQRVTGQEPYTLLEVWLRPDASCLPGAMAFRIGVTEARDDAGRELSIQAGIRPSWDDRLSEPVTWIILESPPRSVKTIRLEGALEVLLVPTDPAARAKLEKALADGDVDESPVPKKALSFPFVLEAVALP